MPARNYPDTLTVKLRRGKTNLRTRSVDEEYVDVGIDIGANVGKPTPIPATIAEQSRATFLVTFTTSSNPIFTDTAGTVRTIRKGDGLLWAADGQLWNVVGPLTPRVDDNGNPVHWWGSMERTS